MNGFQVHRVTAEETRALRHLVLWPHKPDVESCVIDIDDRPDAIHLGCYSIDRQLVGVCSLFEMRSEKLQDDCQYRLRAMAIHPQQRGLGAGACLVKEALAIIAQLGYDVVWCDAREVALGFYARLGFNRIDAWYDVPLIGRHQFMYYRL
jgi:predicted GNAT family N-acyltransferase